MTFPGPKTPLRQGSGLQSPAQLTVRHRADRAWRGLVLLLMSVLRVLFLRLEIVQRKVSQYNALAQNATGLRHALATQQRAQEEIARQLADRQAEIDRLREEYAQLAAQSGGKVSEAASAEQQALFRRLQPLLVQVPTLRQAVRQEAGITAKDVLNMLAPLDEWVADLGYEQIGEAGQVMAYDPARCRVAGQGGQTLQPGDSVRVRYVGYVRGDAVAVKAEVTPLAE